jgi:spore germination protein GerM
MRRRTRLAAVVLIALGAGLTWWWTQSRTPAPLTVTAYLVEAGDTSFGLQPYEVEVHGSDPKAQVADLLYGLAAADVSGASHEIPSTVSPLEVTLEGGLLTVNLTQAFLAGGGSASMRGRLEQLRWSLASLPNVEAVVVAVEGEPLTVMGGEGLMVEQPWRVPDDARTPRW